MYFGKKEMTPKGKPEVLKKKGKSQTGRFLSLDFVVQRKFRAPGRITFSLPLPEDINRLQEWTDTYLAEKGNLLHSYCSSAFLIWV